MLQLVALGAHALHLAATRVPDLGLQLCARRAEQVRFVLDVGFGDEACARQDDVVDEDAADGFHQRDGLRFAVVGHDELADEGVGVEVVDVGGRFEVWVFVRFVAGPGHVEDAVKRGFVWLLLRRGRWWRRCWWGVARGAGLGWGRRRRGGDDGGVELFLLFFDVFGRVMGDLGRRGVCLVLELFAQVRRGFVGFAVSLDGCFDAAV